MIGKTLVHYEITSQLGKGGMGEVYQAKDTKLGRDVAIKVLPEEFALDTDRVARFQREAKLLASLNHPNIAAIYGLEESDGIHFLVMELIEGNTLRDRIKSGPIPVEEALKLALQMAEALEAAHENGVIHRDLKPANIKVTPDGKVKILDFGLAKAYAGDQGNVSLADSPTISAAATQKGVILGTAAYMSPEQAKGKSVDKKADIWAFGVVLFEMLTGKSLFSGEDVTSTVARVLEREPDFSTLPQNLHPRIQFMLERCLKKDPKDRYSGISDARVDIQEILADSKGVLVHPFDAAERQSKMRLVLPWVAATLVLIVIIIGSVVWNLRESKPPQVVRFSYEILENQQVKDLAVSPDGRQFVYSTNRGLSLRAVNRLDAKLILGTEENPQAPFFSPDGKWLGYWSERDRQLKKISISGGESVLIANSESPNGPIWDVDDTILYTQHLKGVMRVSARGGTPELLVDAKGEYIAVPRILPDGKTVMFTLITGDGLQIGLQSLESGERKMLFAGDLAHYLPTGHLVYALDNNLMAAPFDLNRLEVAGGPVVMVEGVFRSRPLMPSTFAVSKSGTLIYVPGTMDEAVPKRTLVWVDRKGQEQQLAAKPSTFRNPTISPDGTKVALTILARGNYDIWIYDLVRETTTRLTLSEGGDDWPLWTPDGQRILFSSNREGEIGRIYSKSADGSGSSEPVTLTQGGAFIPASLSSDGKALILMEIAVTGAVGFNIGIMSMADNKAESMLLEEEYMEAQPHISPDGQWMAYTSDESGRNEVYVRPLQEAAGGGRLQVSTGGGDSPLWSPDGRELFYRSGDAVMAVSIESKPTFGLETPRKLFQGMYVPSDFTLVGLELNPWDIHPDGKRFLMMKPLPATDEEISSEGPRKINIVLNWDQELKQRVPVD